MNRGKLRWWPALLIVAAVAIALAVIGLTPELPHQQRNIRMAVTIAAGSLFLLGWLLAFSRLDRNPRIAIAGAVLGAVLIASASFRITGVSGDLVPIIEPRWKKRQIAAPPVEPPTNTVHSVDGEFPQFYGPDRNAVLADSLDTNWIQHPPQLIWRREMGPAWSGFAIQDGLAITMEQRGPEEYVTAYHLLTGSNVWAQANEGRYATTIAGEGPRTTPTIVSNRVYTFGATGILNCFELASGKRLWSRDAARENDASVPEWGFSSSPLVLDDKVIVSVGGKNGKSLAAYSIDGEPLWAEGDGGVGYSSPIAADLLGVTQILMFNNRAVAAHGLDGKILWEYPWPANHPHVSLPVVIGTNQVLISSGYGTGAELIQVGRDPEGRWNAARIWKSIALKSKFGPIFVKDQHIYGLDDGILTCVELDTGRRVWKEGRYGHGQGLLIGDILLLTSEKGEIVLIDPNPENLREIARFPVFADKTWNPPAFAGEYLLVRNDREAACLKLPLAR